MKQKLTCSLPKLKNWLIWFGSYFLLYSEVFFQKYSLTCLIKCLTTNNLLVCYNWFVLGKRSITFPKNNSLESHTYVSVLIDAVLPFHCALVRRVCIWYSCQMLSWQLVSIFPMKSPLMVQNRTPLSPEVEDCLLFGVLFVTLKNRALLILSKKWPFRLITTCSVPQERKEDRERVRLDSMVLLIMKLDQLDQDIENALSTSSSTSSTPTNLRRHVPVSLPTLPSCSLEHVIALFHAVPLTNEMALMAASTHMWP